MTSGLDFVMKDSAELQKSTTRQTDCQLPIAERPLLEPDLRLRVFPPRPSWQEEELMGYPPRPYVNCHFCNARLAVGLGRLAELQRPEGALIACQSCEIGRAHV